MTTNFTCFWKPESENGYLSQWYPSPFTVFKSRKSEEIFETLTDEFITIFTHNFLNAEQFMMAMKAAIFEDYINFNKILNESNPAAIKALGRNVRNFDVDTWNDLGPKVVRIGTYLKFLNNDELRRKLISTGDSYIVEASPYDRIWGAGEREVEILRNHQIINNKITPPFKGKNILGEILMEYRTNFKHFETYLNDSAADVRCSFE